MYAIFKREVKAYFYSPIAYVLIGLFIVLSSVFFWFNLQQQSGDFSGNLGTMGFLLIFIVPILTMRILAEDRKNGTDVLLITSPSGIGSMVMGKYLAVCFVFMVMTVLTFIYPIILVIFGSHITAQLVGSYVGFILLGAALLSFGVFASALTESQVIAAVISFVAMLVMWLMESITKALGAGIVSKVLEVLDVLAPNNNYFTKGVLGLAPIVYYISFTAVFIFLSTRVIEKRRWSQG